LELSKKEIFFNNPLLITISPAGAGTAARPCCEDEEDEKFLLLHDHYGYLQGVQF